ncbi:hypothetical protein, partial [Escherichia coli]|uniref:hypothetical protein n=1 Tax=Escherichia coli TaxID=562 RepID=UPI001BC89CA0
QRFLRLTELDEVATGFALTTGLPATFAVGTRVVSLCAWQSQRFLRLTELDEVATGFALTTGLPATFAVGTRVV